MFNLDNVIAADDIETSAKPETVRVGGVKRSQAQAALNQGLHAAFWRKACQQWQSDSEQPCMFMAPSALMPVLDAAKAMIDAEYPVKHGEKLSSEAMQAWRDAEDKEAGKGINALIGQLNNFRPESFAVLGLRAFKHSNGKVGIVIHEQAKKTKALKQRLGLAASVEGEELEKAIAARAAIEWDKLADYASGKLDATPKPNKPEVIAAVTVRPKAEAAGTIDLGGPSTADVVEAKAIEIAEKKRKRK